MIILASLFLALYWCCIFQGYVEKARLGYLKIHKYQNSNINLSDASMNESLYLSSVDSFRRA